MNFLGRRSLHQEVSLCRLEKQLANASGQNLSLFDAKLSAALASVRRSGFADRLLASGGSPAFLLGATSSKKVSCPSI